MKCAENEAIITDEEMYNMDTPISVKFSILHLLKKKGAPIKGSFLPEWYSGYTITTRHDPSCRVTIYRWERL